MVIDMDRRMATWHADPQLGSLLFSAIPSEVRLEIYALVLAPTMFREEHYLPFDHDFHVAHHHDGDPDDDIRDRLERWRQPPRKLDYAKNQDFPLDRPGYTGRPILSPTFLIVCRRAYAEARPVMFENERCFWMQETHRHPAHPCTWRNQTCVSLPHEWSRERRRWERKFTTIHLFVHTQAIYWAMFPERQFLRDVEHLKITHRFCDWRQFGYWPPGNEASLLSLRKKYNLSHHFERSQVLVPDPFEDGISCRMFDEEYASEFSTAGAVDDGLGRPLRTLPGPKPSWVPPGVSFLRGAWGREFINMPHIKKFTVTFDASESDLVFVPTLVDWAIRAWRFPLSPGHIDGCQYLSAAGNPVRKMSWRGTRANFRQECPECREWLLTGAGGSLRRCHELNSCKTHWRNAERYFIGVGPRMYTWTVTWTPRKHSEPMEGDAGNYIEPAGHDLRSDGSSEVDSDENGTEDPL